ncbi:MAG: hypothetical protein JRN20_22110 [Nitrososphaerota archaeon]|nr:hypothetical protein [Nitrososphaerota archaeon]
MRSLLSRLAGCLLLGGFVITVYIGLFDSNLFTYSILHYYLNWLIAAVDLLAMVLLFLKGRSTLWVPLAGIVWPLVYFASLVLDFETRLCLGSNLNCWPSVADAYQYLILGSTAQGWTLWPYTVPLQIALMSLAVVLSVVNVLAYR